MNNTTRRAACLTVGIVAFGASLARTDIQTTMQTSLPGAETGDKPLSTITTYSRRNAQRVETAMSIGDSQQRTITLSLCDKKVSYTIDPSLKIYYVTPLSTTNSAKKNGSEKRATGKMTMTLVSFRDKGARTVGNYKTRCYAFTMRTQTSGCLGTSDTTTKQEICVAPNKNAGAGDEFACGTGEGASSSDGCVATVERKGDKALWASYEKVMRDLRVSTRLAIGDGQESEAASETRLVKVSRDKLPDSLFALPQGFRQLSAQAFQAEQSKALMQKMMQEAGADDDDQDDANTDETADQE